MGRSFLLASVVAVSSLLSPASAVYNLNETYDGSFNNFFDKWYFRSTVDPTAGYVDYQTRAQALERGLIGFNTAKDRAYVGADFKTNLVGSTARGRASVRLESRTIYTKGMFVADLFHVPEEACGIWPAFWTVNSGTTAEPYPKWGEIDIYENINEQSVPLNVLHTSPGFTIAGGTRMTDTVDTYNCDDKTNSNAGCAARNTRAGSYGKAFNARGGGTIVMEWSTHFIKIWNFAPGNVPPSIAAGHPDTTLFGTPDFTTEGGTGTIDDHFKNHQIIFDTTFCGNYAGQDQFWQQTSCYKTGNYPTCKEYVAAHPEAFTEAYWIINSLKVFKWT